MKKKKGERKEQTFWQNMDSFQSQFNLSNHIFNAKYKITRKSSKYGVFNSKCLKGYVWLVEISTSKLF